MAEDAKKTELDYLEDISKQVEVFEENLGKKVSKEEMKALETNIDDLKKDIEDKNDDEAKVSKKVDDINESLEKYNKLMLEIQENVNEIKDNGGSSRNGKPELVSEKELEDFQKSLFDENGKRKKEQGLKSLTLKAAETFGYNTSFTDGSVRDAFTGRTIDPELYQEPRKSNLILDTFPIPSISTPKLIYLEKVYVGDGEAPLGGGGADWIDSGEVKPKRSFRLRTGEVEAKKVAIFATVEDKLLRDVGSFRNWLMTDLRDEMLEAINDGLLNNDPAVNDKAPLGLKTKATQFVATPAFDTNVPNPTIIDCIIAMIARMVRDRETPQKIVISSDNYYKIHGLKDADDDFLNKDLVYVNNMGQLYIAGILVEKTDYEDVSSEHIMLIGLNGFKIRAYGEMVLEDGTNGEDFREDKTSFRGYQEFLSYIPEDREPSVIYDTIANVKASIGAV